MQTFRLTSSFRHDNKYSSAAGYIFNPKRLTFNQSSFDYILVSKSNLNIVTQIYVKVGPWLSDHDYIEMNLWVGKKMKIKRWENQKFLFLAYLLNNNDSCC